MKELSLSERELIKRLARQGIHLTELLLGIAHWHASYVQISFSQYMAEWLAAGNVEAQVLVEHFPPTGNRRIHDGRNDWNSYGHPPGGAS